MRAYEYILAKQVQWALNHGIPLIGSKGHRGRPAYTQRLDQNLFQSLEPEVLENFRKGDGKEVLGSPDNPAKMQAVHSSSALGVNVFQYWQKINQVPVIAAACRLCAKGNKISEKIVFEDKYAIDSEFPIAPNIDVVFYNSDSSTIKRFAVECKFSEAYAQQGHTGLKPKYMNLNELWQDIPALYHLAESLCPHDNHFKYLHAAQLIKHILGLKKAFGKKRFRLLYLWYDVLGEGGVIHKREVEEFLEIAHSDGIKFHTLSYQELIIKLSNEYRYNHGEYVRYLSERYL
jgi:hypothetical protein